MTHVRAVGKYKSRILKFIFLQRRESANGPFLRAKALEAAAEQRPDRPAVVAIKINQFAYECFQQSLRGERGFSAGQANWFLVLPLGILAVLRGEFGKNFFAKVARRFHNG